ncbi:MAG TPA: twin-arginine translocase subunit TatC [Alphaproteobacteria bacterium]|jgi:sec-independent protein translocase protein TatC|nr:twin-arginine translocase subunit TatC [Micavibrio sp.]MBK9562871.1 twin-arginine translocase subunit TatC [Micavibrio sp.]HQX26878.1 twin-arginine translocase subunit TatC [Alphaproteobacteria bacterium]
METERMTLIQHLTELRKRLLWVLVIMAAGMGICYLFVDQIYDFLVAPLANAMGPYDSRRLIYTGLTEAFFTSLKVTFFAGVFVTFPFLLWQIWLFIAPGLYKAERNAFLPFLVATPALFFLGGACLYYLVLPMALPFFLSFQTTPAETALPIQLEARVSEYLNLLMTLIFSFGLCFEMPVLLALMGKMGMITAETLSKQRRYAIVIIFVVAAILTPPDILSQVLLAFPLLLLYELSIILVRHVQKPAKPV